MFTISKSQSAVRCCVYLPRTHHAAYPALLLLLMFRACVCMHTSVQNGLPLCTACEAQQLGSINFCQASVYLLMMGQQPSGIHQHSRVAAA